MVRVSESGVSGVGRRTGFGRPFEFRASASMLGRLNLGRRSSITPELWVFALTPQVPTI